MGEDRGEGEQGQGRGAAGDWSDVRTEHEIDRMIQVEYRMAQRKTDRAPTGGRRSSLCPHRSGGLGCSKQRQQPKGAGWGGCG